MFIINFFRHAGHGQSWRVKDAKDLTEHIKKSETDLQSVTIADKKIISIWKGACGDLYRLENFEVNDKESYPDNAKNMESKQLTQIVLGAIYKGAGEDPLLTQRIAAVMQQRIPLMFLIEKRMEREFPKKDDWLIPKEQERFQSVNIDLKKRQFRVVHEYLFKDVESGIYKEEKEEKARYVKTKVVIQGSIDALMFGEDYSLKGLDVKIIHTKSYKTEKAAKKANYFGILGILFSPKEWRSRIH